jgi:quaternary ammonium compound-resistance protein SugE
MAWIILCAAGVLEIGWAVGLKLSDGLARPGPAALTIAAMAASILLLGIAVRSLPLGTAYAVWTGIGAIGTALCGIVLFGEPITAARLGGLAAIVSGLVLLKLAG